MENLIIKILNGKQINKDDALKAFDFETKDLCFDTAKIRKKYIKSINKNLFYYKCEIRTVQ
jgi:hypothetical protein